MLGNAKSWQIKKMKIQIDPHTLERAEERGTNEEEIKPEQLLIFS
jgi:hypothetical protein